MQLPPQLTAIRFSRTVPSSVIPSHLPSSPAEPLQNPSLPFSNRFLRQPTATKPSFHLTITANTMPGKSVVRSWAKRRIRDTVLKELHASGWAKDGRWLESMHRNRNGRFKGPGRNLRGFVKVFTLPPILKASGDEVQTEARRLVGKMVWMCKDGRG